MKDDKSQSDGAGIPGWTPEFGQRFSLVVNDKKIGGLVRAGELVNVTPGQVAKWRDGKAKIPLYAAAILCYETGRNIDWLIRGVEHTPAPPTVDLTVMREVIKSVGESLDMEEAELNPDDLAELCTVIYQAVVELEADKRENLIKRDGLIRNAMRLVKK